MFLVFSVFDHPISYSLDTASRLDTSVVDSGSQARLHSFGPRPVHACLAFYRALGPAVLSLGDFRRVFLFLSIHVTQSAFLKFFVQKIFVSYAYSSSLARSKFGKQKNFEA